MHIRYSRVCPLGVNFISKFSQKYAFIRYCIKPFLSTEHMSYVSRRVLRMEDLKRFWAFSNFVNFTFLHC